MVLLIYFDLKEFVWNCSNKKKKKFHNQQKNKFNEKYFSYVIWGLTGIQIDF